MGIKRAISKMITQNKVAADVNPIMQNVRLLVLDDNSEFRKELVSNLRRKGFNFVFETDNFKSALELTFKGFFKVLIIDRNMPYQEGFSHKKYQMQQGVGFIDKIYSTIEKKKLDLDIFTVLYTGGAILNGTEEDILDYWDVPYFRKEPQDERLLKTIEDYLTDHHYIDIKQMGGEMTQYSNESSFGNFKLAIDDLISYLKKEENANQKLFVEGKTLTFAEMSSEIENQTPLGLTYANSYIDMTIKNSQLDNKQKNSPY